MRLLAVACMLAVGVALVVPGGAATFTVDQVRDAGTGSLRDAIEQSNINGEPDTILFDATLAGKTIHPLTPLPPLIEGSLTIDGDIDANGSPDIALSGAQVGGIGLNVRSPDNTVRGLAIHLFEKGVAISGYRARGNTVAGCYLGFALDGIVARANDYGVSISGTAAHNTVGGTAPADRNVISGNEEAGVAITASDYNRVLGNLIGLDSAGEVSIRNGAGVVITDSQRCRVGNGDPNGRNIISANGRLDYWVYAMGGESQDRALNGHSPFDFLFGGVVVVRGSSNRIAGNYIGTDPTGSAPMGNAWAGILLLETVSPVVGPGNVVGGSQDGIAVWYCRQARIWGNYIGVRADGTGAVANYEGVWLLSSGGTVLGGTDAAARNVISGNGYDGIYVSTEGPGNWGGSGPSLADTEILGNYIGVDPSGTVPLGNGAGIQLSRSLGRTWIGNARPGSGNVIAASRGTGIHLGWGETAETCITRNTIGMDPTGTVRMVNEGQAIEGYGETASVVIGGPSPARGNKIAVDGGNHGIYLALWSLGRSTIRHNLILGAGGTPVSDTRGISVVPDSAGGSAYTGWIADNTVRRFYYGMYLSGRQVRPTVAGNRLNACHIGITIRNNARPNLGNLTNTWPKDEGGNVFGSLTSYAVENISVKNISAEGNEWGTTSAATIDGSLIYDQLDNAGYGRVDYDPLIGGVTPTALLAQAVQLSGLAATPTAMGAEVVFTLSAPAEVSAAILNIAGRPVAQLRARDADAGLNRLAWNGTSAAGTRVPAGVYLVRVRARVASGTQTSALTTVRLAP